MQLFFKKVTQKLFGLKCLQAKFIYGIDSFLTSYWPKISSTNWFKVFNKQNSYIGYILFILATPKSRGFVSAAMAMGASTNFQIVWTKYSWNLNALFKNGGRFSDQLVFLVLRIQKQHQF